MAVDSVIPSSSPSSRYVVPDQILGRQVKEDGSASEYFEGSVRALSPDKEDVSRSMEVAERVAQAFDRQLRFRFREETDAFQVEVLEMNGSEERIIRKIPPDSVINFIEHVQEMFGALIDVEA